MTLLLAVVQLISWSSHSAVAGGGECGSSTGNGGYVVTCEGLPTALLDYAELENDPKAPMKWELDPGMGLGHPTQIVRAILSRLSTYDPELAGKMQSWADSFYFDIRWVDEFSATTQDYGRVGLVLAPGCKLEQMIIQQPLISPILYRYEIHRAHWDSLSNIHQAGAILHELLFRRALEVKAYLPDSETIRQMNRLISSSKISSLSKDEYLEAIQKLGF